MAHTTENKDKLIARVRRIEGQMAAIGKAIQDELGCSALLQQVAGARGAINGLMDELIEGPLREHVARTGLDDAARAAGADELIAVIRRYAK